MPHDRQFYEPEGGQALDSSNAVYDVTQWRKDALAQMQTEGVHTISTNHYRVHEGKMFAAWTNSTALNNGSKVSVRLDTGASQSAHLIMDIHGKFDFEFKLHEGATSSGGTAQTPVNSNRISTNTAVTTALKDVTGITGGTIISHDVVSGGNKVGSAVNPSSEFILNVSTSYIFELTSLVNANVVHINLEWYEP